MTHWTDAADLIDEPDDGAKGAVARFAPGALAFLLSAALGAYLVYLRPLMHSAEPPPLRQDVSAEANPFGGLAPVVSPPSVPFKATGNPFGALVVNGFGSSDHFAMAESAAPLPPTAPSNLRSSDDAPLPPRRPSALARTAEPAAPPAADEPSVARVEPKPTPAPGLFDKLFNSPGSAEKNPEATLAYAAPPPVDAAVASTLAPRGGPSTSGGFGGFLRNLSFGSASPTTRFGDRVAVYDISAHVVYLPDGTRLEAHSGLGGARDDPGRVSERMHGATPPATYALSPRENSFHGVDALRLTPLDNSVYGRAGLLAHSYMLGPDGDSNGCVSFRDYEAFLRAYRSGQINKLVVVTRL